MKGHLGEKIKNPFDYEIIIINSRLPDNFKHNIF